NQGKVVLKNALPRRPDPPFSRTRARVAVVGGCACAVHVRERIVSGGVSGEAGASRDAVSAGRRNRCGGETDGGELLPGMGPVDRGGQSRRWRRRDRRADGRQCAARRVYAVSL